MYVRVLLIINNYYLEADLAVINIYIVNIVIAQYDISLSPSVSRLLDKQVPFKSICIVYRPLCDWVTDYILALKVTRRQN